MGPMSELQQGRYQKLAKVGEGSCGVVFKSRDSQTDAIVAVKKVRFSYEGGDQAVFGVPAWALREVTILKNMRGHPNIVQIQDVFLERAGRIFIVSEFLDFDLRRFMEERGPLHCRRAKLFIWQLLSALAHCHSLRVSHRDVKPQNILVNPHTDTVKLCDFSLGRHMLVSCDDLTSRVASLWYRSPDLLLGGEALAVPLDMWSAGCVLGEMLTNTPIFPGGSEIETLFLQFRLLGTPCESSWPGVSTLPHWSSQFPNFKQSAENVLAVAGGSRAAARLLASLLRGNPVKRDSAQKALSHPYFADLDSTAHSGAVLCPAELAPQRAADEAAHATAKSKQAGNDVRKRRHREAEADRDQSADEACGRARKFRTEDEEENWFNQFRAR